MFTCLLMDYTMYFYLVLGLLGYFTCGSVPVSHARQTKKTNHRAKAGQQRLHKRAHIDEIIDLDANIVNNDDHFQFQPIPTPDSLPGNADFHVKSLPRHPNSVIPEKFFNTSKNCNRHAYKYLINNPQICRRDLDIFMLIAVRTTIAHVDRRMAIRDTWGASFNMPNLNMPVIFLVGASKDASEATEVRLENQIYGDIIQEDFVDSRINLTLKSVMAYKWAYTFCPQAQFVMVANDEVVVDIFKLVPYLQTQTSMDSMQFPLCYLYPCCLQVQEEPAKYHRRYNRQVDKSLLYEGKLYPPFCSSMVYVAPSSTLHKLYFMSLDTPLFLYDEAWVGVLVEKLGIIFTDTYRSFAGIHSDTPLLKQFNNSNYLTSPVIVGVVGQEFPHTQAEMIRRLWGIILSHNKNSPPLDVKRYMSMQQDSDNHIYTVAAAALLIDLGVMAIIGYIIFCRKGKRGHSYLSNSFRR